jgi:hypothetical protein
MVADLKTVMPLVQDYIAEVKQKRDTADRTGIAAVSTDTTTWPRYSTLLDTTNAIAYGGGTFHSAAEKIISRY